MSDRTKLLRVLARLDQADAAANQIVALDAGPDVDKLAETISNEVDEIRTTVRELLVA